MDIHIRCTPSFDITLTSNHIALLAKLSVLHYDNKCKSASEENGFLKQWEYTVSAWIIPIHALGGEPPFVRASFSDLDTCLKILEVTGLATRSKLLTEDEVKISRELRRDFSSVLQLANDKYHEWQAHYIGKIDA
jgi:hypothetical protein